MMILNERKINILNAIINDYIATAEPIGSRTIAKKYDLGISSATIRNEMSDLEDLGLILQPHASSGRIPTDKGYRLYVDSLMQCRDLTEDEITYLREVIVSNISQIDYLMKETAKAISILTNYTTIVSEPQAKRTKIKHMQIVPFDENAVVLVIVTDAKSVKNITIPVPESSNITLLNKVSEQLNKHLAGEYIDSLTAAVIESLLKKFKGNENIVIPIFNAVIKEFQGEDNLEIYTSGAKNILGFPEFSDIERAKEIFQALEEKQMLITLLNSGSDYSDTVEIVIGDENSIAQMKNCSIIRANYRIGDSTSGGIGIIGPTRMNYSQAVSVLNGIVTKINSVIKTLSGGG